jgi:hypothetical protein
MERIESMGAQAYLNGITKNPYIGKNAVYAHAWASGWKGEAQLHEAV